MSWAVAEIPTQDIIAAIVALILSQVMLAKMYGIVILAFLVEQIALFQAIELREYWTLPAPEETAIIWADTGDPGLVNKLTHALCA
jgi:hypothetical protein